MPPALVDLKSVTLDETALRYLGTKKESTRKAYDKCLKRFVLFSGKTFKEFLEHIEDQRRANLDCSISEKVRPGENLLRGFIEWHKEAGYSNYAILQAIGAIQNILKYYGIPISFNFIETPPARTQKKNNKHEWTLDQIRQFVESAEYLRDKAYIMFAFQSGLSIGDILDLDYSDIRREYEAGTAPLAIQGYREKTNVPIKTFIGWDALYYLRLYLQSRTNIKLGDPVFTLLGTDDRATPSSIQKKLRDYAKKLDFVDSEDMKGYNPLRPHSLRSAFRSRLTGRMDGDLIEFFMAHSIGQSKTTYINMPIDDLREIYTNYEHLISIEKTCRKEIEEKAAKERIPQEAMDKIEILEKTVIKQNYDIEKLSRMIDKMMPAFNQIERMNEQIKELNKLRE